MITYRLADATRDLPSLVALYDGAARWMQDNGIVQWTPGEKDAEHFRRRITEREKGEVWLAETTGRTVGGFELWWEDLPAWGEQPPVAGYVHRLMVDRASAPPGTGRALLDQAEQRIAQAGRERCRLDCVSTNPRLRTYYENAGYTVVGEHPSKVAPDGRRYGVTLLEKRLDSVGR
ncbi:N-acetyltransferase [Streptomyces gilvosporeus]|uniref:N-acetyltransferase n=2 Tax=Streptomyces gilvosporeus TaxID=553510 RepID=A0A1V0U387_9ACTN|nr:N-acetyltransferase [Streptomyces gilvosporeus]